MKLSGAKRQISAIACQTAAVYTRLQPNILQALIVLEEPCQEEHAHVPPRKRMRWKQPAPSGSEHSPANLCFREANKLHSELLAMLDQPDDAIRLESRSSRESKHKGNLLNTFEGIKECCTARPWRC